MDSSNITSSTNNTTTSYQEIPLSSFLNLPQPPPPPPPPPTSSPSFFDPLPSYLPTFHQEPPSSSSSSHPPPPASSSKKRPRASRRAPTTVLTTDTSNFRAMVQEFTGFPAPPLAAPRPPRFASSSSPYFLPRPSAHNLPSPSHAIPANAAAYPFATTATLIGLHNHNIILAPPPQPQPQFGDHLTSFVANSDGLQQQHIGTRVGSLSSWADDQQDHHDPGQFQQQLEKRRKTNDNGGVVESWIHSSD